MGRWTSKDLWDRLGKFHQYSSMMNLRFDTRKKLYVFKMKDGGRVIIHLNFINTPPILLYNN